ncbi:uncharacterized protein METZ01_LOCUS328589, partial [marine metagenome]
MADGIFTDLRTHWFGHFGSGQQGHAGLGIARHAGGVLTVANDGQIPLTVSPGADPPHLVRLGMRVKLHCLHTEGTADHGQLVELRQENDPAPKCSFLEEGP